MVPESRRLAARRASTGAHHPTENRFNALAHRQIEAAIAQAAPHAHGRLLDVGCGLKPYRGVFAPYVTEHIGVDHPGSPHPSSSVDIIASAYAIPLDDASVDTVLMTEVLEHLEDPHSALAESFRLLRPNGLIVLTAPHVWPLHEEPRDFFRYTPHGLRHLLAQAGFSDIDITPLSGQWATLALLTGYALRRSPARHLGRVLGSTIALAHSVAVRFDDRAPEPWMSWNHLAMGWKKPAEND
jgi:SAM-dependent methyltransferase